MSGCRSSSSRGSSSRVSSPRSSRFGCSATSRTTRRSPKLSREANGIAHLYAKSVNESYAFNEQQEVDRPAAAEAGDGADRSSSRPATQIFFLGPHRLFPGQDQQPIPGLAAVPAEDDVRLDLGQVRHVRVHAAGDAPAATTRSRIRSSPGRPARDAIGAIVVATKKTDVSARVYDLIERLALAGILGLLVAGAARAATSRAGSSGRCCSSPTRPTRSRAATTTCSVPQHAPGELGHLSERFGEMAARLAEVEEMERNFLMSVSHELRTPLTAIRGHVAALLEGVVDDPAERAASLETVEPRRSGSSGSSATSSISRSSTRTASRSRRRRSTWCSSSTRRTSGSAKRRGGGRSTTARTCSARPVITSDGDRVLQVVGNLLSNAFHATPGRRAHLARARAAERHGARRGRGQRPGHPAGDARAAVPAVRLADAAAARASGSRSRRSSRRCSAVGSTSTPRSAEGSRFELLLPAR